MLEIAPEDSKFIREMTQAMRRLTKFNLPTDKAPETYSGKIDYMKMMAETGLRPGSLPKMGENDPGRPGRAV